MEIQQYNIIFKNAKEKLVIKVKRNTTIKELIRQFFEKKKSNLLVDNFEYLYFVYNGNRLPYENNLQTVESLFKSSSVNIIWVNRLENYCRL